MHNPSYTSTQGVHLVSHDKTGVLFKAESTKKKKFRLYNLNI